MNPTPTTANAEFSGKIGEKAGKKSRCYKLVDPIEDGLFTEEMPRRIPEGPYNAICIKIERGRKWGESQSLYIHFRIIDGEFQGTKLWMPCRMPEDGKWNHNHKFFKNWVVSEGRLPNRREKINPKPFLNRAYKIRVRTTKGKDAQNQPVPELLRYSVVDWILEPLTGPAPNQVLPEGKE